MSVPIDRKEKNMKLDDYIRRYKKSENIIVMEYEIEDLIRLGYENPVICIEYDKRRKVLKEYLILSENVGRVFIDSSKVSKSSLYSVVERFLDLDFQSIAESTSLE